MVFDDESNDSTFSTPVIHESHNSLEGEEIGKKDSDVEEWESPRITIPI